MASEPTTLQEAVIYFSNPVNCREYLVARRWPNGVTCPACGSTKVKFSEKHNRWQCSSHHSMRQFTVKTGTIFEDSPLGLDKWLCAMWEIINDKNGVSSYEISRKLKITQKSCWFMLHRLREAMQDEQTGGKLGGPGKEIEADESFIGGKARNMHKDVKARKIQGRRGPQGKAIVAAVLERGGKVRAKVVDRRRKTQLQALVRENVEPKSALYSDALKSYDGLSEEYAHEVIDHAVEYVRENVHTNGLENFWSLLKRGLHGTYISVEPYHLFRYVDEQAFRFNNREMTDSERFSFVCSQITGRRLTWNKLTGKEGEPRQYAE
jgi:transposase-like protein